MSRKNSFVEADIAFENAWGNAGVRPLELFFYVRDKLDLEGSTFEDILANLEEEARVICRKILNKEPSTNSLNRCRGDWFELCVLAAMWDFLQKSQIGLYFFKMPDNRDEASSYIGLFDKDERKRLSRLSLHCSNPDFVCVRYGKILSTKEDLRTAWERGSSLVAGKLHLDDVLFALAAKTHPRPDRRYQHLHEAVTLKTLHLIEGKPRSGIGYYVVMLSMSEEDERVYEYPIPYLLAKGEKRKAIDRAVTVSTFGDLRGFFQEIVTSSVGMK